ncbi:MAG: XRE family transcriptional regulator [Kiritimatiellae bacterium]|nr:XRE family transcriptional regulator [Kiritimatiellia bacterium]
MGKRKTFEERDVAIRVGSRIRKLREIQHVTQTKLAEEIGIRAGPLGWIEKGKHLPSGRVLYRIARQLNVKIDDLFQEQDVWESMHAKDTDMRAPLLMPPVCDTTTALTEAVKSSHIICQAAAKAALEIEGLCGVTPSSELPLHIPFELTDAGAEYMAGLVRQSIGAAFAITNDYIDLLEEAGAFVVFADMPHECATFCGYDLYSSKVFFFINFSHRKRMEWNLYRTAFELGRVLWNVQTKRASGAATGAKDRIGELDENGFAQRFAAYFLLPSAALRKTVGQLGLAPESWSWELLMLVKKRYGVAARLLAERLHELGLSRCEKRGRGTGAYCFKGEIDAFEAENGIGAEPEPLRKQVMMNLRLSELVQVAERSAAAKPKELAAVKRILRQSGIRLEA